MLEEEYRDFTVLLPDTFSEQEKKLVINDLIILAEIILENEDMMKIVNQQKL